MTDAKTIATHADAELDIEGLLRWRCIGPFRGGRVVAVAGDPRDRNTYYFGAVAGGVWKTTDGGTYWRPITDGFFRTSSVGALAVAASDPNVVYAGTGETTIRIDVSHGDGVYKSTDAGRTWANMGLEETRHIAKVRVHPTNPDVVWVAAFGHAFGPHPERGVFKSEDGGTTWRNVLHVSDKAGAIDLSVDETNPRVIYAAFWEAYRSPWMISSGGPGSGLWKSEDGGETWAELSHSPGLPEGTLGKLAVVTSPARSGRVWALVEHAKEGGLYRSDDHGETWEKVSDNQNLVSRAWYYVHLTADPIDPDTVYVNNLDFYKSTDGGRTFVEIATPHGDNHDLWIDPRDNRRMIQGNDGGANVSTDGGVTFTTIYNQPTAQFFHLAADDAEPYRIYGTQQDNSSIMVPSRVDHAAITWADCAIAGTGESGYVAVSPTDPDVIFVGAIGSSPGGGNALQRYDRKTNQIRLVTTWPEERRGWGARAFTQRFAWTYPILFSPHDPQTLYVGGNRIHKSTDEGQTWAPISPDLSKADPETLLPSGGPVNRDAVGAEIYATVFALIESPHQAGVLWAGTDDGLVHRSPDGGATWQNVTPPDLPEWTWISGIEPSPFEEDTVYLVGMRYKLDDPRPYLWVTRDAGASWSRIDGGLPADDFARVLRADPECRGLLYLGTESGVFVSFDDGASWKKLRSNLPVSPIHELLVKDGDLIAGTHGRSIWILDDLAPLRALADGVPDGVPHFFAPRTTKRWLPGVDWSGNVEGSVNYFGTRGGGYTVTTTPEGEPIRTLLDAGENPPRGAILTYRLTEAATEDAPISLAIRNAAGETVRSYTSRVKDDEPKAKERRLPAKAGWNRFVWDLRHDPATRIEGKDPAAERTYAGPFVAPGTFTVTLRIGETELSHPLEVVKPRHLPATQADLDAQHAFLLTIHRQLDRTAQAINRMRDLRWQLDGWAKRAAKSEDGEALKTAVEGLRDRVLEIEKQLQIPDLRPGWADELNEGVRLLEQLAGVTEVVQLGDYPPTAAAEGVRAEVTEQIEAELVKFEALVVAELPAVNAAIATAGFGAVAVA